MIKITRQVSALYKKNDNLVEEEEQGKRKRNIRRGNINHHSGLSKYVAFAEMLVPQFVTIVHNMSEHAIKSPLLVTSSVLN